MADSFTNTTLGLIPGFLALGVAANVAGNSLKMYPAFPKSRPVPVSSPKYDPFRVRYSQRAPQRNQNNLKPIVRSAVGAMIAIPLIGATSSLIGGT